MYEGPRQIGFARVISDYATFAYLADVYIDDACRGQGLGKELIACIMSHEQLQGLRRWMLATQDAHGFYEQYGFVRVQHPERLMEIVVPDIYLRQQSRGTVAERPDRALGAVEVSKGRSDRKSGNTMSLSVLTVPFGRFRERLARYKKRSAKS